MATEWYTLGFLKVFMSATLVYKTNAIIVQYPYMTFQILWMEMA